MQLNDYIHLTFVWAVSSRDWFCPFRAVGTTRQQRSKAGPISSALSDPVLKISLLGRPRKTSNVKERFCFLNCELVVRKDLQEHHNPVRFSCLDIPGHLKSQCSTLTSSAPTQMIKAWTRVTLSPAFGVMRSMFRRAGLVIQQSQRKKLRFTAECPNHQKWTSTPWHLQPIGTLHVWGGILPPTTYRLSEHIQSFLLGSLSSPHSSTLIFHLFHHCQFKISRNATYFLRSFLIMKIQMALPELEGKKRTSDLWSFSVLCLNVSIGTSTSMTGPWDVLFPPEHSCSLSSPITNNRRSAGQPKHGLELPQRCCAQTPAYSITVLPLQLILQARASFSSRMSPMPRHVWHRISRGFPLCSLLRNGCGLGRSPWGNLFYPQGRSEFSSLKTKP